MKIIIEIIIEIIQLLTKNKDKTNPRILPTAEIKFQFSNMFDLFCNYVFLFL